MYPNDLGLGTKQSRVSQQKELHMGLLIWIVVDIEIGLEFLLNM